MIQRMASIIDKIRWLSLDIVVGSVVLLHFTARHWSLSVPFSVSYALAAAVWLIYTADHLLDARSIPTKPSPRRKFHKESSKYLKWVAIVVLLSSAPAVLTIPRIVLWNGLILSIACVLYLAVARLLGRRGAKELAIAVIYASGILLFPFSSVQWVLLDTVYWFQLALLAFGNLLLIAYYEAEEDDHERFSSLVQLLGKRRSRQLTISLCMFSLTLGVGMLWYEWSSLQLFYCFASTVLLMIAFGAAPIRTTGKYAPWVDGIFFIPLLL